MTGQFIKIVHQCEYPNPDEQGLGSIWKCECDKEWISTYGRDLGKFWYWINQPKIEPIFHYEPTFWDKIINKLKGEKE